jgi:hypothetical protein
MIGRLALGSCIDADRRSWTTDLSQTTRRTSHARPAHIERLIPSASTQGQGDEYLRPGTFPMSMFMCSRRSLARSVAPKVCPASRYRCLNPSMAIPCRFKLPSHTDLTRREPNDWVRRMFQSWTILDQIETPNPQAQIFNRSTSCGRRAASLENIDVFRCVGRLQAFEFVFCDDARLHKFRSTAGAYKFPRIGKKVVNNNLSTASRRRRTKLYCCQEDHLSGS